MTQRADSFKRPRKPWYQRLKKSLAPWRSSHAGCQKTTPEQDKIIARRALYEDNEPKHAAFHVAGALYANPNDREALDLADELMRAVDDPLELVPMEDKNYAGTVALRAYFLAEAGRLKEGLNLLRSVMRVDHDKPYEFWTLRWLERPEALEEIPTVDVAGILSAVVVRFRGHSVKENPKAMAMLKPWLQIARRFAERRRDDGLMLACASLVVRRSGEYAEALNLANEAYRLAPSYMAATARATVHEALGDDEGAMAAYLDALRHEPESPEILADMALLELRRGNLNAAMECTRRGLKTKPDHRTLEPLEHYLAYRMNQDEAALQKLKKYLESHPNHAAKAWLDSLRPYVETLPSTAEATLNVLTQILPKLRDKPAQDTKGRSMKLSISAIEAPSARLATQRALAAYGMTMTTTVENIATPDPRVPCRQVRYVLWTYEGTQPQPGLPVSPEEYGAQIAQLASPPYDLWSLAKRCGEAARERRDEEIPQMLAVAVHPPTAPSPELEAEWILKVQVTVAMLVRQISGGAFRGSAAEDAILSMLYGPMDWTNIAAIVALMHLAIAADDKITSEYVGLHVLARLKAAPKPGHCSFVYPALWALVSLPKIDARTHQEFIEMYNDYRRQE